jgi:hypothetical protein
VEPGAGRTRGDRGGTRRAGAGEGVLVRAGGEHLPLAAQRAELRVLRRGSAGSSRRGSRPPSSTTWGTTRSTCATRPTRASTSARCARSTCRRSRPR